MDRRAIGTAARPVVGVVQRKLLLLGLLTCSAEDKDASLSAVQFETGCEEYATRPSPHVCIASVIMDEGVQSAVR